MNKNTRLAEYEKAETTLHIALKMAQDMGNQDGVTFIFDQMANMAFARVSDFEKHFEMASLTSFRLFREI